VLHTWNQKLLLHPHVHCVVPAVGRHSTTPTDQLTPHVLSSRQSARACFSRQVCCGLQRAFQDGQLDFHGSLQPLAQPKYFLIVAENVFSKRLGGLFETPLRWPTTLYSSILGAIPIAWPLQPPLGFLCGQQSHFPFGATPLTTTNRSCSPYRWMNSCVAFLLHVLPKGFVRIRHFGFLAHRRRATTLPLCFQLLGSAPQPQARQEASIATASDLWFCPQCGWADGGHRAIHFHPDPTPLSACPGGSCHMSRRINITKSLRVAARAISLCLRFYKPALSKLLQSLFPGRLAFRGTQEHPRCLPCPRQQLDTPWTPPSIPFNPIGPASTAGRLPSSRCIETAPDQPAAHHFCRWRLPIQH